jgi:citrate synthase
MESLKKKFIAKALPLVEELKQLKKDNGEKVIGTYTFSQVIDGMRDIIALFTDTSVLDPQEGIRFRGYSIPELQNFLPSKVSGGSPLPEGLFHLMLVNEIPTKDEANAISKEWANRIHLIPEHVFDVINVLSKTAKPMTQFATAILTCSPISKFQKAYREGINKKDHWDPTYEDVMDLIAVLPRIAAYIYRVNFHDGKIIEPDPNLDWAANFAHMMGYDSEEIYELFRLYMVLHADHEGGNVSAHTTHLVGTALSNAHYSYAAGMLGLAGPLHGFANMEVMTWIFDMLEYMKTDDPSKAQISEFIKKTITEGKVIPGYGHAVLRKTDPRYTAQLEFANRYFPDDKLIGVVRNLYEVVPPILSSLGKVKNPWPNVDAISGSRLYQYGIK